MENQEPKKVGLLKFLQMSMGSQFVIPVYQRNYTWTANKEVKQYFEDLENVLNKKFDKHFLGIIIYLDTPIDYSTREFSVIDGQQRLTTTFLILYAIKDLMIKKGETDEAIKLENQFLVNQYVPDKLKLKLKPLVADDQVYKQIVFDQFDEITEKGSNIYKNYIWIIDKIESLLKDYTFNDILMALDKLYVVCVPVTSNDSPQKIFESINSTGAKLVASDLIRNYILMDIPSDIQETYYNLYWKKIEENLSCDSKKIELFFRMFLACKLQYLPNKNEVYNEFKTWFKHEFMIGSTVENCLKEIVTYSKYYHSIYSKPIDKVDADIRDVIKDFRNNLSEMPAPLLMEIYNLYSLFDEEGNRLVTAKQFCEIINLINVYLIRRSICSLDTSDITRLFPTVLKDIINDCKGKYVNIVDIAKKNLVNKQRGKSAAMPTDDDIRNYLVNANVYNNRLTLRIIFDKMETYNNPAPVDLSKLSVEHLMPQTPTKEWLDALSIDAETYEKNLHRLGNLTLATRSDNSKMKNKPWEYKKEILSDTAHLIMNQRILEKEKWTIDDIECRTLELIEQFLKLYPYLSASSEVIEKHDISIDWDGIVAFATLYEEDGGVEITEGSEIVKYDENTPEWCVDWFSSLLDEGIVKETDSGAIFIKPLMVSAQKKNATGLSAAAGLVLGGNRNGWEYWKDENGNPLNENKELKKKLNEK
ncbi:MAG: DUF262 domain-containing protein [Candidatus Onthovivens sp.]|nr:DUF262 domain-containing protein [Candidatus Onthovivens sp.]